MNLWDNAFSKTQLAFTFHGTDQNSYEEDANNGAIQHKFMMFNTGLNERNKTEMRERYSGWRLNYGVKVGWADLTHVGENATILDAYKEGIGVPGEKEPLSQVSYVAMSYQKEMDDLEGGLTDEQEEARAWAYPRLLI